MDQVDVIVVGAGVVGLAIAAEMSAHHSNTLVVDQHSDIGQETSSRNSEVIHAGLYYPEDSLKAQLCVEGKHRLYQHCESYKVNHQRIGKLLIAVDQEEHNKLEQIQSQATKNGVEDLESLTSAQLAAIEPELKASAGVLSPSTGIVDSHGLMVSLVGQLEQRGGFFVGNTEFLDAQSHPNGFVVTLKNEDDSESEIVTSILINSCGLHSEDVANKIECLAPDLIPTVSFARGHYFSYSGRNPFKHLIYPMPEMGGLGIHGTLDLGGQLRFGPDVQFIDSLDYSIPADRHDTFAAAIKRYWPSMDPAALHPAYSGIRPKLGYPNKAFSDFVIQGPKDHGREGLVNLFGIESPGLTSALAIGSYVRKLLE